MSAPSAINWLELTERLPEMSQLTLHNVTWDDYEELLDQVGEAAGLRISYNDGTLQIMTLSPEHENYVRFFESLITAVRLRLRINIRSFGSATMKKRKKSKGNEPDACFYVQSAVLIGNRIQLDFAVDPPPDIAVEVDLYHDSMNKLPIYAALGVSEVWRYDGQKLTIHLLQEEHYIEAEASPALPLLTGELLTGYLNRLREEGEFQSLLAFDEWLQSQQQP
ncbi:MAG: Uma2 family endonuclease [Acidobacteria bacterium]|nr:Uma2 family endonuclease [Acidobacteriota bacterium]